MAIEKRKLFEQARDRWPLTVNVVPTDGDPRFHAKPSLFDIYSGIEASCEPEGVRTAEDEWTGLANWSFCQAVSALAEGATAERELHREEVTFEMFDEWMCFNLSDD